MLLITLVWAVPLLGALFPEQVLGRAAAANLPRKSPAELAQIISQFKVLSWIRWLVLLGGFLSLLHALRASKSPVA